MMNLPFRFRGCAADRARAVFDLGAVVNRGRVRERELEMLLLGQFSIAFLLKAWYGDKTFALSWHLFLTQVGRPGFFCALSA
jgi:hypothetical protein